MVALEDSVVPMIMVASIYVCIGLLIAICYTLQYSLGYQLLNTQADALAHYEIWGDDREGSPAPK